MERVPKYYPHNKRNAFEGDTDFDPIANSVRWTVKRTFRYVDYEGNVIEVPAGFTTDFASIPPLARFAVVVFCVIQAITNYTGMLWFQYLAVFVRGFALWVCFVAEWLENSGTDMIACVHDYMYSTRCRPRWKADYILFTGMVAKGATRNPLWKRVLFLVNVRLFGWKPWQDDARQLKNSVRAFCKTK